LGRVPDQTPLTPLQQDLRREQKRLRLPPEALERTLDLDLRKPNGLDRSRLLHRLSLVGVPWGELQRVTGQGTFHELWRLRWQPEFEVNLIEASRWGNTISDAARGRLHDQAGRANELSILSELLDRALLADLPDAVSYVMVRLQNQAALATDVAQLMDALPPLADVLRYGNVRQTDAAMVREVVRGLVTRVSIGLPGACASLNDEAAAKMFERLLKTNGAIALLQDEEHTGTWRGILV